MRRPFQTIAAFLIAALVSGESAQAAQDTVVHHLGKSLHALNYHKFQAAMDEINQALAQRKNDLTLLMVKASIEIETKDNQGAIADCDLMIKLYPNCAGAYSRRGYCLCRLGQFEKGVRDLDRAIALNQLDFMAWNSFVDQDNKMKARKHYKAPEMTAEQERLMIAKAGVMRAEVARDAFDLKKAQEIIEHSVKQAPDDLACRFIRGVIYLNNADYKGAVADFNYAVRLNPKYAGVYYLRAEAHARLNADAKAIADYTKIIALDPLCVVNSYTAETGRCRGEGENFDDGFVRLEDIYVLRGKLYAKGQQKAPALADLNKAISMEPDDIEALLVRAGIHTQFGQTADAIKDCDQAIAKQPKNWHCYEARANAYEKSGQLTKAVEDCDRIIKLFKDNTECYMLRAHLFERLGNYQKAAEDYSTFLTKSKDDDEVIAVRGDCYMKMGQFEKAIADYSRALALEPDKNLHVYARRAEAYEKTGKHELAVNDRKLAAKKTSLRQNRGK